jgi:hypothetical protein
MILLSFLLFGVFLGCVFDAEWEHRLAVQKRRLAERLKLNKRLLENKYWFLPYDNRGHEDMMPVGRGDKYSDFCGKHRGWQVCKNVDQHGGKVVKGVDYTNKVAVKHQVFRCNSSSCSVCFALAWALRLARSMAGRLEEGVKKGFGKIEHATCSVPKEDYGLSVDVMRKRALLVCLDRGFHSGGMIFHGFRMNKLRTLLVYSPHFHILGFIRGGYGCRDCDHKWNCTAGCGGFDDGAWRGFQKDGYWVKVHDERKSIVGSCWYQLNHSTVRVGVRRFQVVTWFGVLANRKMKSFPVKARVICPACGADMERSIYKGKKHVCLDFSAEEYAEAFADDEFDDVGDPNWET